MVALEVKGVQFDRMGALVTRFTPVKREFWGGHFQRTTRAYDTRVLKMANATLLSSVAARSFRLLSGKSTLQVCLHPHRIRLLLDCARRLLVPSYAVRVCVLAPAACTPQCQPFGTPYRRHRHKKARTHSLQSGPWSCSHSCTRPCSHICTRTHPSADAIDAHPPPLHPHDDD